MHGFKPIFRYCCMLLDKRVVGMKESAEGLALEQEMRKMKGSWSLEMQWNKEDKKLVT